MSLPRKTTNAVRYARLTSRGLLTRLAMVFSADPRKTYTGEQIAEILIRAVGEIGSPELIEENHVEKETATGAGAETHQPHAGIPARGLHGCAAIGDGTADGQNIE